jgi:hypothetical protein
MIGLAFTNEPLKKYNIGVMMEALKLRVDESGAKVESMAIINAAQCGKFYPHNRQFLLNKTFWLVMKENKKHPYLCIQVVKPT